MKDLGPLVAEDELLVHQVTDTFGAVGQSDRSWTEKIWVTAAAPDGSLQMDFGLGRYPNRGILDGFAGTSRGREQWTVRASRELGSDDSTSIGPIHYEVLEPLHAVRIALDAQDVVPVSFDLLVEGTAAAHLEERELRRSWDGRRVDSDLVRFHQTGTARGWVSVDGRRQDVNDWFGGRDRSWGVRYMIGAPVTDLPRAPRARGGSSLALWSLMRCVREDGSAYALHAYVHAESGSAGSRSDAQGGAEEADGTKVSFADVRPELSFDPVNRRLLGGVLHARASDGGDRPITLRALGDTGFHLGAGRYFSFDGRWHGQHEGALAMEGEHIADCTEISSARRLHQLRDCLVAVSDPGGGGTGIGTCQTVVFGAHPGTDASAEGTFL